MHRVAYFVTQFLVNLSRFGATNRALHQPLHVVHVVLARVAHREPRVQELRKDGNVYNVMSFYCYIEQWLWLDPHVMVSQLCHQRTCIESALLEFCSRCK